MELCHGDPQRFQAPKEGAAAWWRLVARVMPPDIQTAPSGEFRPFTLHHVEIIEGFELQPFTVVKGSEAAFPLVFRPVKQ